MFSRDRNSRTQLAALLTAASGRPMRDRRRPLGVAAGSPACDLPDPKSAVRDGATQQPTSSTLQWVTRELTLAYV